jgi:uncharacterized protein
LLALSSAGKISQDVSTVIYHTLRAETARIDGRGSSNVLPRDGTAFDKMGFPFLSRIRIYPIKSLDPVELQEAEIGSRSLRFDREFALLTAEGRFMNGKKTGRVNELKAAYDLEKSTVSLSPRVGGQTHTFHLHNEKDQLEKFLSTFFNESVSLTYNTQGRLMDIPDASSVTVISTASLDSLHASFADFSAEDLRLRFRANLEIGGTTAFWEETLFGKPGHGVRFRIGEVEIVGVSPRARCNVPPRDPHTGVPDKTFVRRMMKSREASLPEESLLPAHGGFYHLTINTYLPDTETGKKLRLGDRVEVLASVAFGQAG